MDDIEKVKQGCECCDHPHGERKCRECPYKQSLKPYCNIQLVHDAMSVIEELQAEIAQLQPRKGSWIFTGQKNAYGGIVIECPFCEDKYAVATPLSEHFCRNCGAKLMD